MRTRIIYYLLFPVKVVVCMIFFLVMSVCVVVEGGSSLARREAGVNRTKLYTHKVVRLHVTYVLWHWTLIKLL